MILDAIAGLERLAGVWAGAIVRASWQGGVALALAWVVCRFFPRISPEARTWLWRLAYLKLFVALIATSGVELPILPPRATTPPLPAPIPVTQTTTRVAIEAAEPSALPASLPEAPPMPRPSPLAVLFLVWLAGVGVSAARSAREHRELSRFVQRSLPLEDEAITASCAQLCRRLGLRPPPRLRRTLQEGSPLLAGLRPPSILLPSHLLRESTPSELTLILAHELSHLKRRDLWWNCLPALTQCLFWFHPLVWLSGRDWRLAQELACDQSAVRLATATVGEYAALLTRVAARRSPSVLEGLSCVGVLESYHSLKWRLIAMRTWQTERPNFPARTVALVAVLGILGLVPWRVVAQEGPTPEESLNKLARRVFQVVKVQPKDRSRPPSLRGGDLVFKTAGWQVKNRVIAGPGDHLRVALGQITVNGRLMPEPIRDGLTNSWKVDRKLGPTEYLLFGEALDGKKIHFAFGVVSEPRVIARAIQRVEPSSPGAAGDGLRSQPGQRSEARLKQLANALRMYAQDYHMVLPPMESAASLKKALYPYVRRQDAAFVHPDSGEPYQANPAVSRHQMIGTFRVQNPGQQQVQFWTVRRGQHPRWMKVNGYITDPAHKVAFFEPTPAADGTRGVVFLDGRFARLSKSGWARLKVDSQ